MPQKKETLRQIRTGLLTRGLSLAKASFQASRMAAKGLLSDSPVWLGQVEGLIRELGQLKGTAMKVGQTLSMYGEHLLPKEVNDLLKTLQQNSPPLHWDAIRPILERELGPRLAELEVESEPVASASIGQVHRARVKTTGEALALKVQYPGVDSAVDTDLKLLKFILNVSDLVPRGPRFDQVFEEIREMFLQEIDYRQEFTQSQRFYDLLKDDPRYLVPKPYPQYSTGKVLATAFIEAARVDAPEVLELSLERRNRLGLNFLDLYLHELFVVRAMQTDPHLGNYRVAIDPSGEADRLVLFDFGAVREVPAKFLESYALLVEGGITRDERLIEKGGRLLGLLQPTDGLDLVADYVDLCFALTEPFTSGAYDWRNNDLPKRVAAKVSKIAVSYKLRAPPRELVFLDRKLGGVFIFLSVLGCVVDGRDRVEAALAGYKEQPV